MTYKNKHTPWRDEDVLRELYFDEGMTQDEIADHLDTTQKTISDWFKKHNIKTAASGYDELKDKSWLHEHYVERGLGSYDIADKVGCCQRTVLNWLDNHNIETRRSTVEKPPYFQTRTDGYEEVKSKVSGVTKSVLIHRLLAVAEYGFDDVKNMDVHHQNTIKWDNRYDNIEIMTPSEHGEYHSEQRNRDNIGNYA